MAQRQWGRMSRYIQVGTPYHSSFSVETGDFRNKDEAWNAFLTRGYLPASGAKIQNYSHTSKRMLAIIPKMLPVITLALGNDIVQATLR